jgi:hypothetical protein
MLFKRSAVLTWLGAVVVAGVIGLWLSFPYFLSHLLIQVTVYNLGTMPLENVSLHLRERASKLGAIAPGTARSGWIRAAGPGSELRLRFTGPSEKDTTISLAYVEVGFTGSIVLWLGDQGVERIKHDLKTSSFWLYYFKDSI